MRGHYKKKNQKRKMSKLFEEVQFPRKNINKGKGLKEEVVTSKCERQVKEKLDKHRYRSRNK